MIYRKRKLVREYDDKLHTGRKNITNHISNTGLISKLYKELLQVNMKNTTQLKNDQQADSSGVAGVGGSLGNGGIDRKRKGLIDTDNSVVYWGKRGTGGLMEKGVQGYMEKYNKKRQMLYGTESESEFTKGYVLEV